MSESASSDNPEAGQAAEVKNGESNAEGTKEPGGIIFYSEFLNFDYDTFLWLESCKKQWFYKINEVLKNKVVFHSMN